MSGKKVLVVDDEIHIVHVVSIKLRNNGYEALTAENGQQAYELACSEKPDVVITDCQMPIMDGLELVGKMRETEDLKEVPVIMLTARSFAIDKSQQEELGIRGCVSKPFSPKELLRNIEDVLYESTVASK